MTIARWFLAVLLMVHWVGAAVAMPAAALLPVVGASDDITRPVDHDRLYLASDHGRAEAKTARWTPTMGKAGASAQPDHHAVIGQPSGRAGDDPDVALSTAAGLTCRPPHGLSHRPRGPPKPA